MSSSASKKEARRQHVREAVEARAKRRSLGMKLLIAAIVATDLAVIYVLFPFANGNANVTLLVIVVALLLLVIVAQFAVKYAQAAIALKRIRDTYGITKDDMLKQMAKDAKEAQGR